MLTSKIISGMARTFLASITLVTLGFNTPAFAGPHAGLNIFGRPATSITVGQTYNFVPEVYGENLAAARFSIKNKPSWLTFSSYRGALYGVPTSSDIGTYSNITISVTDGKFTAKLRPFSITVSGTSTSPTPTPTPTNTPPVISGLPPTSVVAGTAYSFRPTASDADGNPLTFSISGMPAWASFSASTGQLAGTPTSAQIGTYSNIIIRVSDGTATTSLPAFAITVNAAANVAPTISGTPITTATAGSAYSFRPTASDANNDPLTFSATGLPSWATFSPATGQIAGTPTVAGTFSNIVISVSDGRGGTASLPAFGITVRAAQTGSARLSWTPPTTNTDGSALTNLAGYRISYGTSATAMTQQIEVPTAGVTTYLVENLAAGTWYFSVVAYTSTNTTSSASTTVTKTIQ